MSLADTANKYPVPERPDPSLKAPKGWEPGITWSESAGEGTLTTHPVESQPTAAIWKRIIADFGLDPEELEIVDGSLSLVGWTGQLPGISAATPVADRTVNLTRYKVRIQRRLRGVATADARLLSKVALRRTKIPPLTPAGLAPVPDGTERPAFVVNLSDWQLGKGEGDGSAGTVARIKASCDRVLVRLMELNLLGRGVDTVYVVGLGDLVEQCVGHYPSQTFTVDLNHRQQMEITSDLIFALVDSLVMLGYRVVMAAVPGNHGEQRLNGKAFTTISDNDDLAVFSNVARALAVNPERYGNVTTFLPEETYSFTLDIGGVGVGFFHGHVTKGGGTPSKKIQDWWTGQIVGQRSTVRDAMILVTGHYHHLLVSETSGRTHLQCPAMDPGSLWWSEMSGQHSPAGMLTFLAGKACGPRGWSDMLVV